MVTGTAPSTLDTPVTGLGQALSDLQSAGGPVITIDRVLMYIASVLVILQTLCSLLRIIRSFLNQVPATVDTLLKIKSCLEKYSGLEKEYLERYEKIQRLVAMYCAAADISGNNQLALWRRIARANREASLLLQDISLRLTANDISATKSQKVAHCHEIQNTTRSYMNNMDWGA